MTLYHAQGGAEASLGADEVREALSKVLKILDDAQPRKQVIALPPDFTRFHSQAGMITCLLDELLGDRLTDVMPALGTHVAMPKSQTDRMFPTLSSSKIRVHNWREDVVTVGTVDADFVTQATEGIYTKPWPAQLNRMIWEGGHDLIVSIGQVVPHEVIGMANYNKNLFVGTGGVRGINESHFIGAVYGMERMMGRADTPLRRILNQAQSQFCGHLPLLFIQTVVSADEQGGLHLRGLFIGDDVECFERACELSLEVNFQVLDEEPQKIVAMLDPEEFHSTWLGNKAVYRTRMAIADEGELIVLAPGVKTFGEDGKIDALIREHGYRTTPEVLSKVESSSDLQDNLSAAAHLIHGSSENRFKITYCPGGLTREEIESVGYQYADLAEMTERYDPNQLSEGWNTMPDGETIFFIPNPALGLWASRSRLPSQRAS